MDRMTNERKFTAPLSARERALAVLDHVCDPDPLYPVGTVNSVYFDTPQLTGYTDKDNGTFLKRKTRMRWYSPEPGAAVPDSAAVFLEIRVFWRIGG